MNPVPVQLVAVGDIMLGRGITDVGVSDAMELLPTEIIRHLRADIVTGNLECLIGSAGEPSALSHSHFQANPEFARSLLQLFDVVSLANNHIGDYGDEGIRETLRFLAAFGVRTVGIGQTAAEAAAPVVFDIRGHKIAIFGATTVGTLISGSRYTVAEPGPYLYGRVSEYRDSNHTCLLHLHAGGGDVCHPSAATRRLLDEAAEAGFTVVLGHHPHIVQGYVAAPHRAIFYSLGDFLFDRLENGRDRAMLVNIAIGDAGALVSTQIHGVRRTPELRLELLEGEALRLWRAEIQQLSEMILTGESDRGYRAWQGNRLRRLLTSVARDYKAGGIFAVWMKIRRVARRARVVSLIPRSR